MNRSRYVCTECKNEKCVIESRGYVPLRICPFFGDDYIPIFRKEKEEEKQND